MFSTITVLIDKDKKKMFKIECERRDQNMTEVINNYVDVYLEQNKSAQAG